MKNHRRINRTIIFALVLSVSLFLGASHALAKQKISCPKSSTFTAIECLGYVESSDKILNDVYAYLLYKETRKNSSTWKMKIKGNITTGTSIAPAQALKLAGKANADGKSYFTIGSPLKASDTSEKRVVEFRIYQKNGKPTDIEIYVVTRNASGGANAPKTLKVKWPQ